MDGRSFYLFDRLSDPTAKSALQEWVQAYNNDLIRRGLYGWLPAIALVDDPYSVGQCGYLWFRGYSLATICSRDEGSLGLAHFGMEGAHNEDIQPWVSIRPGVDYNTAFSVICAEMGHLLGLGHQPNNSGSCSVAATPYGQKRYYNEHDFQELLAIYGHYW